MSVAYQSWEVGTGPKGYIDGKSYRWQQHHHTDTAKANISTLSMFIHNSHESPESKPCSVQSASPVSRNIECGPVSSFVLPCSSFHGSERVPLIGEDLDASLHGDSCVGWNSQRSIRTGSLGPLKIHPHQHGLVACDRTTAGLSTDCLVLPTTNPSLFPDCVGPALSSSSSSIGAAGEDSLSSSENDLQESGDVEVQSAFRAPLNLSSLEDSLPIKRGLSRYFTGQSKSFGCLADALSTSLAKPANPYAKRRKSFTICDDRHRTLPPLSRTSASGISKKTSFGNRSSLAVAVAMGAAQDEEEEEEDNDDHPMPLPSMGWGKPRANAAPSRSYSLSDLQGAAPTRAFSLSDLQGAGRN